MVGSALPAGDNAVGKVRTDWVRVRCTGFRKNGELCNELLLRVELSVWESALWEGKLEIKCPRCDQLSTFR